MRRVIAAFLVLFLMSATLVAPPSRAYVLPIVDIAHIIQSYILQFGALVQHYLAYAQRALALYRQYQQLAIEIKNIETWEDAGMFIVDHTMDGYLQRMLDDPNTLSYMRNKDSLARAYDELYPKVVSLANLLEQTSGRRTKNRYTLRQDLLALSRLGEANSHVLSQLKQAEDASRASDGMLKELEAANMFHNVLAQDSYRNLQATLIAANTLTLRASNRQQLEEESAKLTEAVVDVERLDNTTGRDFSWVPDEWNW